MKIDKSKVENQQVTLTLEVEEDEIEKYLVQAAKKLSNQLKIPGFRKGKAPKSIVEKVVGREGLVEESLQFSVPNLVNDAIDKENLEVFATPKSSGFITLCKIIFAPLFSFVQSISFEVKFCP